MKIKQALAAPPQAASYVVNLPQPPVRNAEEYLKAYIGYIYTAVGAIAQEVASVDLHLYKVGFVGGKPKTTEIFEHQILSVLHYVNQLETFYNVVEATQTYLELVGEAFWVVLGDNTGVKEFWLLRPDWVKVIPSAKNVIDHYNYYAGGVITEKVEIPKEFVVPFRYFHPMNPYRGKGPVQAAALPFDILNFAQEYNRNFFFNSAIPSMVFSSPNKISENTSKRFLQQWEESFGGRTKANKIAFLGNGLTLDKASFAAKELDFTEQMKNMRDDVLAVFKVPKTVLGLTEDVNRANADATTRAFMERVITPRMRKFVDSLNEFFVPMFVGENEMLFLDFTDPSPEDVELKLKRYQNGRQFTWLTPNEIRAEENLEPLEGGDDLFAPLGSQFGSAQSQQQLPAGQSTQEGEETPNNQDENKPVEQTGEEEQQPKGIRAQVIKILGGKLPQQKNTYVPPKYLEKIKENKEQKHMVKVPYKRPKQLLQEKLKAEFMPDIRKMLGQLLVVDDYSALKEEKKGSSLTRKEKELKALILEGIKAEKLKKVPTIKNSDWDEEQKTLYWKQFIQHVTEREGQIKETCKKLFNEQEKYIIERLQDQLKSWRRRLGVKATAQSVVPTVEELSRMWKGLEDILREIYIEQGNYTMDYLGAGGVINITTEFASEYLVKYGGQLIKQINETTRANLMDSLETGFSAGESVDALAKRVQDVFTQADSNRAEMIARTEAIHASNAASVEAYRQSGVVVAKEWLAERDGRTCPFCEELDGKAIPLDDNYFDQGQSFTVADQTLNFDYADVGEPPVHPDCRCTTIPVLDTGQQGEPDTSS